MNPESPAVAVRSLEKRFGKFVAVNQISFEVGRGEVFGFLGPNGAGKSTTIRILCGILAPSGGQGEVAGYDIATEPEKIKASIGYMSQRFSLYEDLTVEENIDFYSGIYRIAAERKKRRKDWVLQMAGLEQKRGWPAGRLTGGWKQRLALGCAVLHEPPIVFLDEPTSGVDPISRRSFWELIYALAEDGVTIFVTTHYMDEAEYCDRLGMIYRGELVALGTPEALKRQHVVEEVLEVYCPAPEVAIGEIESLPAVREAALYGRGLHVMARPGEDAAGQIQRLMAERGWPLERLRPIPASLEDVFVSLVEARDRQTPL